MHVNICCNTRNNKQKLFILLNTNTYYFNDTTNICREIAISNSIK